MKGRFSATLLSVAICMVIGIAAVTVISNALRPGLVTATTMLDIYPRRSDGEEKKYDPNFFYKQINLIQSDRLIREALLSFTFSSASAAWFNIENTPPSLADAARVSRAVKVTVPRSTTLYRIQVQTISTNDSIQLANAIANAYCEAIKSRNDVGADILDYGRVTTEKPRGFFRFVEW